MFLLWTVISIFCSFFANSAPVSPHPNRVIHLPGAPQHPEFPMYSGFLNASADGNSSLFYFLVESIRVNPSAAPLLVWFNGGPGGSSLAGFFKEHGPYLITESSGLTYNEYSWNQYANVLYLESPLGTGFSQISEDNYTEDDETATDNSYFALLDFMTRVHPNYVQREYYLSGQSYAGASVPWLARRLLQGITTGEMPNGNFKGFALGNPVFTDSANTIGQALVYLINGAIPQNYTEVLFEAWKSVLRGEGLDRAEKDIEFLSLIESVQEYYNGSILYNMVDHCPLPEMGETNKYHRKEKGQSYSCYATSALEAYLGRIDVQTSLHVNQRFEVPMKWESQNFPLYYRYNQTHNTFPIYNDIIRLLNGKSFRMLVYHGDTDGILPVISSVQSTTKIAADNNLTVQEYTPVWHFFGDYAGARTGYRDGNVTLDMLTVRGAGHSVPTSLPDYAFQMIHNFIYTEEREIDYSKPILKH